MPGSHPLDRPVWQALTTCQSAFAERAGQAVRMRRAIGPFAAGNGTVAALADLARLIVPGEQIVLVEPDVPALPPSLEVVRSLATVQMVAANVAPGELDAALLELGHADAAEIHALATLTKPGPFATETHRLGRFVGLRERGRLVAMAGERLRIEGFTEASAVCTHPQARGRGFAKRLLLDVMRAIVARGQVPFLHCYATNKGAIGLYESIGFRHRATLQAITVRRFID